MQVGGVGDRSAIGRVEGSCDHRGDGGEALGFAAVAAHGPDVVSIEEGDPVLAERGVAQQERRLADADRARSAEQKSKVNDRTAR